MNTEHHRRPVHASSSAQALGPHSASICFFPTARGSWTSRSPITAARRHSFSGRNRLPSSAVKLASCIRIRHLRYGEAMSDIGEFADLWEALLVANPIAVTDELPNASLRQRNAYFSSSDAAFQDRYQAERRMGARQSRHDRGRWRLAHLFERPRPLREHAHSSRLRATASVRQANRDARFGESRARISASNGLDGPAAARSGGDEGGIAPGEMFG